MKPKKRDTLANALDQLIEEDAPCSWKYLEQVGNRHSKRLGLKTRCTPGIIKAHIKYRQIKDANYLGKRYLTSEGIMTSEIQKSVCRFDGKEFIRWETLTNDPKGFQIKTEINQFLKTKGNQFENVCDDCLYDIMNQENDRNESNLLDELADDESNPWPGLDPSDYRSG